MKPIATSKIGTITRMTNFVVLGFKLGFIFLK